MTTPARAHPPTATPSAPLRAGQRRALVVLAVTQLLLVMDGTLMNIALPTIQTGLGTPISLLTWVVTAYALAFGGLLMVSGRLGDAYGHRRVFTIGMTLFGGASFLGAVAPTTAMLIAARALQGVAAALTAPNTLSLVSSTFPTPDERQRAMGLYSGMSGLGSTIGLLLGGVLTSYASWRWALFINVPVAVWVVANRRMLTQEPPARRRIDVVGAIAVTVAALSLVYAATRASEEGWTDGGTTAALTLAAAGLVAFLVNQARSSHALIPTEVVRSRSRAGAYLTQLLVGASMFATYFLLTLHIQHAMGYTPVQTGVAYLPLSVTVAVTASLVAPRLLRRASRGAVAVAGLVSAATGATVVSQIDLPTPYFTFLVPAMVLVAFGLGLTFVAVVMTGMEGVAPQNMGAASGLINTAMQLGGAIGVTLLAAAAAQVANGRFPDATEVASRAGSAQWEDAIEAVTVGHGTAFAIVAAMYVLAAGIAAITFSQSAPTYARSEAVPGT